MKEILISPAEYVVKVFGGVRPTARALGRNPSSVCRWKYPTSERGLNGRVPSGIKETIMTKAQELGLEITRDCLDRGAIMKVD